MKPGTLIQTGVNRFIRYLPIPTSAKTRIANCPGCKRKAQWLDDVARKLTSNP